jgi:hypothetical protein
MVREKSNGIGFEKRRVVRGKVKEVSPVVQAVCPLPPLRFHTSGTKETLAVVEQAKVKVKYLRIRDTDQIEGDLVDQELFLSLFLLVLLPQQLMLSERVVLSKCSKLWIDPKSKQRDLKRKLDGNVLLLV